MKSHQVIKIFNSCRFCKSFTRTLCKDKGGMFSAHRSAVGPHNVKCPPSCLGQRRHHSRWDIKRSICALNYRFNSRRFAKESVCSHFFTLTHFRMFRNNGTQTDFNIKCLILGWKMSAVCAAWNVEIMFVVVFCALDLCCSCCLFVDLSAFSFVFVGFNANALLVWDQLTDSAI